MKHRRTALVPVVLLASAGCGVINNADAAPAPTVAPTPAVSAASVSPTSIKDNGDIPDPCTLLSRAEVTSLTGRRITQVDRDGAAPGDVSRFCQWQQDSGQLALFLSRTTADDFKVTVAEAHDVDGVGQAAFTANGHLYVLYGTVQVDVYSRGGSDEQNLGDAKKVAKVVIPRI
ncbi:hypothetical protein ACWT_2841 [Actinoplanes sp. SE50]|uniref:DUF3558 family protein n=1 Tax=unclassified Actinoplanes TaxID=2626549 RepID=UPI00023EC438|nr:MULTISPECIES: DUF3558 family protein [unclassified Actinoplanes]AEV83600.1 hypothetical protein ACPL_2705 [Actinoplanes sp. SE50/110]ATO82256.1 hypothetical protein ACWT_2841 [Actinoplanes sp. SE50]SLL99663.1 DUF3558 domain-containing protein [Actinoplanes sp. SE50/110]